MRSNHPPLELWAGVECTVNRVGDQYFDQLERNGHAMRIDDLDLFASISASNPLPSAMGADCSGRARAANWSWA